MLKKILILSFFITTAHLAGIIGSFFTAPKIETWYFFLEKPFFSPPNWLFAPVWIVLYTLMGISAFIVLQKSQSSRAKSAFCFYGAQLLVNALWSVIFFGFQSPFLGFLTIIALWFLIFVTTVKFWKIEKFAGLLFLPYFFWVTFAMVLNFFIWQLNA